ncbi:MAG: phosphatidylinositol kinase [Chloroflexota bacterium]
MRPDQRVPQLTEGETDDRLWSAGTPIDTPGALALLRHGELEVVGRVRDASNVVLYCSIAMPGAEADDVHVAYKPIRGERPLDDFPTGTLANREEAAWWVSEGSAGRSCHRPSCVTGRRAPARCSSGSRPTSMSMPSGCILVRDDRLRPMALFDALVNNADRKGGHLLVTDDGRVHGVDHGICFAAEPKLRTVLWGWRGEPLTDDERADLRRLCGALDGELGVRLGRLLSGREADAQRARARRLLADGRLPPSTRMATSSLGRPSEVGRATVASWMGTVRPRRVSSPTSKPPDAPAKEPRRCPCTPAARCAPS